MDLRVYVDGVARIICDLTRTTTVHDIIIALAQYKGKAGRYSLIERAPDGTQRTLSPNELTCELIHHLDWAYILQQNPSNRNLSNEQKRSKSLDGQKSSEHQQSIVDMPSTVISSSDPFRTVKNNNASSSSKLSQKVKRSNLHQIFPSINTNDSNNNIPVTEQKRLSRTPLDNQHLNNRHSRPKSAIPATMSENSAFYIVHKPNTNHINLQQQQYTALLKVLKDQEIQIEQQKKELEYREMMIHQAESHQNNFQHELQLLEEHERHLLSEYQTFAAEYSSEKLDMELEYYKKLHANYEHLQQQLTRCSTTLEQKRQLQEQIQLNIQQTHEEIEQIQTNVNIDKKEITQCEHELERSNSTLKQQEELVHTLTQRNNDTDRIIQQHRQQIIEIEHELTKSDDSLIHNLVNSSYHFDPTTTTPPMPVHQKSPNRTLWKLSPSGIWV